MNFHQKVAVAVTDILVIGELCVSMYFASRDPENLTPVFVKSFLCMLIPTLLLAKVIVSRLRSKEEDSQFFD